MGRVDLDGFRGDLAGKPRHDPLDERPGGLDHDHGGVGVLSQRLENEIEGESRLSRLGPAKDGEVVPLWGQSDPARAADPYHEPLSGAGVGGSGRAQDEFWPRLAARRPGVGAFGVVRRPRDTEQVRELRAGNVPTGLPARVSPEVVVGQSRVESPLRLGADDLPPSPGHSPGGCPLSQPGTERGQGLLWLRPGDVGPELDVIGRLGAPRVHREPERVVLALGDRIVERREETRFPASDPSKEELQDHVVVAQRPRTEGPKKEARAVHLGLDLDWQVVVLLDGDRSGEDPFRNERRGGAFDRRASRQAGAGGLEAGEHLLEVRSGAGTERVSHSSIRLSVNLQPERGRRGPDERRDIGRVLGRRRQQQFAMDESTVHALLSAVSGLLG